MICSILQVSRGRERLLTASVRHFTLCGISDFYSIHWLYTVRKVIVLTAARVSERPQYSHDLFRAEM